MFTNYFKIECVIKVIKKKSNDLSSIPGFHIMKGKNGTYKWLWYLNTHSYTHTQTHRETQMHTHTLK